MEMMMESLKTLLPHRDIVGYAAARNTRILSNALTEYFSFKEELIRKYGEPDRDENGRELSTISVKPNSLNFGKFTEKFDRIKDIEHDVELMTIKYSDIIGILNGEEILRFDWMLTEGDE